MSVLNSDLVIYGSANMPDVDGSTTGGALATSKRTFFTDLASTGTVDYVSSSASDTAATITISGRDATGVIQSEAKTLTGTTVVTGSQSFERMLKGIAGGTTAVGDIAAISHTAVLSTHTAVAAAAATSALPASITLASGDGGSVARGMIIRILNNTPSGVNFQLRMIIDIDTSVTDKVYVNKDWGTVPSSSTTYSVFNGMLFELGPNQVTEIRRPFYNVSADVAGGSSRIFYEKVFVVNNNTSTALTLANIIKQTDPSVGTLDFSLTNSLNDTATVANRQTAPASGVTAYSSGSAPQTIAVPSPQNLPSGAAPNAAGAEGIWLRLTLAAGTAAAKTSETIRVTGSTT